MVESYSKYAVIFITPHFSSCGFLLFCQGMPNTNYMHTTPNKYSLIKVITHNNCEIFYCFQLTEIIPPEVLLFPESLQDSSYILGTKFQQFTRLDNVNAGIAIKPIF